MPDGSELRIIQAYVFVAECGEHELSFKRAVQQFGQIPQTLQTQLGVHAGIARQRVTATSSYSLVSPSYIERSHSGITTRAPVIIADKYSEEEEMSPDKDASRCAASRRAALCRAPSRRADTRDEAQCGTTSTAK